MSDIPPLRDNTILDAYCIVNLYASDVIEPILGTLPGQKTIIRNKEVRYIYADDGDITLIDLQPLLDKKLLSAVNIENEREQEMVVNLAFLSNGKLDDSAAFSASIASSRNWTLAIDDKDAILLFHQYLPQLHTMTTLDLFKYWVDISQPSFDAISDALGNMQRRAKYMPDKSHYLYRWWQIYRGNAI